MNTIYSTPIMLANEMADASCLADVLFSNVAPGFMMFRYAYIQQTLTV